VWNRKNDIATPATDNADEGLTSFGKKVVEEMIAKRMIIDVAHLNRAGIEDVYELCKKRNYPFITSHTGVYACKQSDRNISDKHIKYIQEVGGVVGVALGTSFIGDEHATMHDAVAHLQHIERMSDVDTLGIGTDLGGVSGALVQGVRSTKDMDAVVQALQDGGYTNGELKKILGKNYLALYKKLWDRKNYA
jgi:membrane dipeptidase